jgi:hypothetical protein
VACVMVVQNGFYKLFVPILLRVLPAYPGKVYRDWTDHGFRRNHLLIFVLPVYQQKAFHHVNTDDVRHRCFQYVFRDEPVCLQMAYRLSGIRNRDQKNRCANFVLQACQQMVFHHVNRDDVRHRNQSVNYVVPVCLQRAYHLF